MTKLTTVHMFTDNGEIIIADSDGDILCRTTNQQIAEDNFTRYAATVARIYPSTWRKMKAAEKVAQAKFLAGAQSLPNMRGV